VSGDVILTHTQQVTILVNISLLIVMAFIVGFAIGEYSEGRFRDRLESQSEEKGGI
jgi:hypothetical protein